MDNTHFELPIVDGVCIVRPQPSLNIEWDVIDALSGTVLDLVGKQPPPPRLLFDLSRMDYFGSIFLSLMLRCWKRVNAAGGKFAICGLTSQTREVVDAAQLNKIWTIYADADAAVTALKQ